MKGGGGGMGVVESKMSNNECENTYSTDMGFGELQAILYNVLESRFKCNQGAVNTVHVFQLVFWYTHVNTIECIIICWSILATCDEVVCIYHFVHWLYSLCASPQA